MHGSKTRIIKKAPRKASYSYFAELSRLILDTPSTFEPGMG